MRMAVGRRPAPASIAPRRAERGSAHGPSAGRLRAVAVAGGRRLAHERGDQLGPRVGLGVPLDPEGEAARRVLDRLGQVVEGAPARLHEALTQPRDGLVVVRLGGVVDLAGGARGERAVGEAHPVVRPVEGARDAAVVLVADVVGQVLDQRAPARDVHELHPAADAQQRDVALERPARERDLELVALRPGALRGRMRRLAVGRGVDVGPAREDEPVEDVEQLVGILHRPWIGRQHERETARALDRVDVGAVEQVRLGVPHRPARALESGADADPGSPRHASRLSVASAPMPETVTVSRGASNGALLRIELNRPESMNAWDKQLGLDLRAAVEEAADDESVRAVTITGAGRGFSSGADLKAGFEPTPEGHPDVGSALRDRYHPIISTIRRMPKPVLAAVNGPAVGIGCSLALACDLIVARESAYFLLAFVNIGLVPDGGSSLFIPARIGHTRASEMAMLGERIHAPQALDWGLINRVATDDAFDAEVDALTERLATGPTRAYAGAKRQLNAWIYAGMDEQLELEAATQQEMAASGDFMEGVQAFLAKRAPDFTGS